MPKVRWGHTYKAGTVFEYTRPTQEKDPLVFVLLEDRCITPQDVLDDTADALCLVLSGRVYEATPGTVIRLKGIIDAAEEML
jgi:hypothetical protein